MTAAQLARECGVTPQTVRGWVRAGLPVARTGQRKRIEFDDAKARAWVKKHADLTGRRRRGGKRAGAGKKRGEKRQGNGAEPPPVMPAPDTGGKPNGSPEVPATAAEVDRLAAAGLLTAGGLGLAESAARVRRLLREEAIAAAAVLPVEEVTAAWGAGLARLSVTLERLTARIASRLAEVGLPPHQRHTAAAMIDEEVSRCRVEMITAYRERIDESSGNAAGGDR